MTYLSSISWCGLFLLSLFFQACQQDQSSQDRVQEQRKISSGDLPLALSTFKKNAETAADQEQLDSAVYWYQEAITIQAQLAKWDSLYATTHNAFIVGFNAENFEPIKPLVVWSDSVAAFAPDTVRAKIAEIRGYIAYDEKQYAEALTHYKRAAAIWEQYPPSKKLGACYNMFGIIYNIFEDYPLAEQYYRQASKLSEQFRDTVNLSDNLFNLGKALMDQKKWREALISFERSKVLFPYPDGSYEANMALAYLLGDQPKNALPLAKEALRLTQQFTGWNYLEEDGAYRALGDTYLALDQTEKAVSNYERMLTATVENYGAGDRETAKAYLFLGAGYQENKDLGRALRAYHQSIETFLPTFNANSFLDCPSIDSLFSREGYLMEALRFKGQVLREQFERSGNLQQLEAASEHFIAALHYINQIKALHTETGAKAFYGRQYSIPYCADAIKTQMLLHQNTKDPQHLEKAYFLARQATAYLLRESINDQRAMEITELPQDIIDRLNQLNRQISETQTAFSEEAGSEQKDSLQAVLFGYKRDRLALMDQIQQEYSAYYQLRQDLQPHPLSEIQAQLEPNQLVIDYFMSESELYTFAYTAQRFEVFATPVDDTWEKQFTNFRRTLADLDYIRENARQAEQEFITSSRYLYAGLLDTVLQSFPDARAEKLLIIPDGVLNYLAFECLLQKPTDSWLNTEAFLVHKHAINYAYYADLLLTQKETSTKNSRFLGFGTEYDDQTLKALNVAEQDSVSNPQLQDAMRGKQLSKLLFADDEVSEVSDLVGGDIFLNQQATKSNFLLHSPDYDAIHIAAHSFIDDQNDSTAYIAFHQTAPNEDFLLSLPEIYGLDLKANLVSLSSCQTGIGALEQSEGVMSLARAFNFAGSKSMLASQWSIADRSSYLIMKTFYGYLKEGLPKDEALQKAKLDYLTDDQLSNPAYRLPAYWGGIILIGDPEPLAFPSNTNKWWGIVAVAVIFIFVLLRPRRTQ